MTAEKIQRVLAIDIGGSKIMTGVGEVDVSKRKLQATLTGISQSKLTGLYGQGDILTTIGRLIRRTLRESGTKLNSLSAIGLTIPGVARPADCYWVYAPFSGIREFPIGQILSESYSLPVSGDNDVNACAWAEHLFGVCTNVRDYLWVTISNGIGGGLVLDGRLYPGANGGSAEIGHFHVVDDGALCGCGRVGCLEAEAAGPAIARRYRDLVAATEGFRSSISPRRISAATVAEAARQGDVCARATYRETGRLLGRASAMAANLINPAKIVFGGGVSAAFDLFLPQLQATFRDEVFLPVNKKVRLEKTGLGYEAGLLGAVAMTLGTDR